MKNNKMTKTVKQHEQINLHIKKKTFYSILKGIFIIPVYLYCLLSLFIVLNGINETEVNPFFYVGASLALPFFMVMGGFFCVAIIDLNLVKNGKM